MQLLMRIGLALVACRLWGQYPVLTKSQLGSSPAVVRGPGGHLWIGAAYDVLRFDGEGRQVWKAELEKSAVIVGMGLDAGGTSVVISTTGLEEKGFLTWIDGAGRVLRRTEIAGMPRALAVDAAGNAYVTGRARDGFVGTAGTLRPVFPERECSARGGDVFPCDDAFVSKFDAAGKLVWSTLLGGGKHDSAYAIQLAGDGSIWVGGETESENFPVSENAGQKTYGGGEYLGPFSYGDGFVARLSADGSRLEYGSFLGGARWDRVTTMTVVANALVVGGASDSTNFPITAGALQAKNSSVGFPMPELEAEAFVAVLGGDGTIRYGTYFGEGGKQVALTADAGAGTEVLVPVSGTKELCLLVVETSGVANVKASCQQSSLRGPFRAVGSSSEWLYVGASLWGRVGNGAWYLQMQSMNGSVPNIGMNVKTYWTDSETAYRPVLASGGWATFTLPGYTGAAETLRVSLDDTVIRAEAGENGAFRFLVPEGLTPGIYAFRLSTAFFTSGITAVDVTSRWPGLASAALNQDGGVNSENNPAARGSVVSLFGTGLRLDSASNLEVYVESGPPFYAAGMELLFAGRVGVGLEQVNVRVPEAAAAGHVLVRIVMREGEQIRLSNLARIWIR